ncbi:hypothetical protein EJ05DRAFT_62260 [Pseudovirgaria hyperparasitica]|uniref:Uncharacterized protein n=1 Tax=Pseudovirgaria hyperparasitica TaxID=470096 RepID=A0A6A6W440_9PEZI|nr:uncharacterized protein EJ05DRAFT_62260 [Pseudovirgaria hyperparasitica]KAF2756327.1 hypothetical protein EJ05DRAFT_62260 [Pseudovirgaria hyperparasitica]
MATGEIAHLLSGAIITLAFSHFEHFENRHIPSILVAALTATGGTWPVFSASSALTKFGFQPSIAAAKPAFPVITVFSARDTTIGLSVLALYAAKHLEAIDIIWSVVGYIAFMDAWVLSQHGRPGQAMFRFVAVGLSAMIGIVGLTSGVSPVGLKVL